jgi:hypothetical protein
MQNSKLHQLLVALSPTERRHFRKFIRSPYFNTDQKLVRLSDLLLDHLPEILSREQLDQAVFPGTGFQYARISNLLSYITQHLIDFLALGQQKRESFGWQKNYLLALRKKELNKLFQQESRKWHQKLPPYTQTDEAGLYARQWLEKEQDAFFLQAGKREEDESLLRHIEALDQYYVLTMLKSICQLLNRQNILQTQGIPYLQEAFVDHMQRHHAQYEQFPLIQAYYQVLQCLLAENPEEHYRRLRQLLDKRGEGFPQEALHSLYQYARNICIKQSNQGQTRYLQELFRLYQEMIERELIYADGYLSQGDFKNIVSLGIRLGEYDWTEQFLQSQSVRLPPEQKENALLYNKAQLLYARGRYRAARRKLVAVEFEDVFYHPGAKTLLLKIYYELDEAEALAALLRTFAVWLQRNKLLSPYQKEVHQNLIRFVKKLQGLRARAQAGERTSLKSSLRALAQAVAQTPAISQKAWLEQQIEGLFS